MLNRDRPIQIEITVDASQTELLAGLEAWQRLGLLSDQSIRHLCQLYLVCPLPEVARPAAASRTPDFITDVPSGPTRRAAKAAPRTTDRTADPTALAATPTPPGTIPPAASASAPPIGPVAQRLQSLMSELSVIWLLFLGVFLVVVSSGVLAASQWQNFSPIGQYLVLLGYTVAFWVAGIWTGRSPNLHLTARMVQGATVLLIPINIWMMDAIAIWRYPLGLVTAAIASLALLAMLLTLLRSPIALAAERAMTNPTPTLIMGNSIALSALHWGWSWDSFPLIATYLGTLGTAASLAYRYQTSPLSPIAATPTSLPNQAGDRPTGLGLGAITVAIAALLLIARAILVAGVPIHQLALALGICGWLLCWLSRRTPAQALWRQGGVALMLLGWFVSVSVTPPWQAIAISGLGMWLLGERMMRDRRRDDLTAFWLVGLQACLLLGRAIPIDLQTRFVEWVGQQAGDDFHPFYLAGPLGLPYLLATLGLAIYLKRTEPGATPGTSLLNASPANPSQPAVSPANAPARVALATLDRHAGSLALILGVVLISISLPCGLTRSLTLTGITLALGIALTRLYPRLPWLIYLTHSAIVAAIASWISWFYPTLPLESWGLLLVGGTVTEWLLAAGLWWSHRAIPKQTARSNTPDSPRIVWSNSAWVLGLVTASLSYGLLLLNKWDYTGDRPGFWLIAPMALTVLAYLHFFPHRSPAAWFSTAALVAAQVFTLNDDRWRLLGLGLGMGLMLLNTRRLHHRVAAFLTVGFGIALTAALIWQGYAHQLEVLSSGVILLALAVLILWVLRFWLLRAERPLLTLYAHACNVWAIAIGSLNGLLLTSAAIVGYSDSEFRSAGVATAAVLLIGAIAFRIWQQPTNLGFLGMAWGIEVATISLLSLNAPGYTVPPLMTLAIANLGLALATQVGGDGWVSQKQQPYRASWHIIPLIYAGLGIVLGHSQMTATTGLYTLAAALVGIGVGRRLPALQFLTMLSCFGVSLSAYELLLYQLAQAEGGAVGDGFALLTVLAAAIALLLQIGSRWLSPYLRLTAVQITGIAHIHWALGIVLLGMAMLNPTTALGQIVTLAVTVALSWYALWQGRQDQRWIYTGFGGLVLAIAYGLYHLPADVIAVRAWAAALACPVAIALYFLPWQRWGWTLPPWRQAAIGLPLVVLGMTVAVAGIPTLLIAAGFYAWLANSQRRIRLSYISLALADWGLLRWMFDLSVTEPIVYVAIAGLSVLYGVKVDPALQDTGDRHIRHLLRCLAVGMISLTALHSAEANLTIALLTLGYSIALIFVGIALRVRAYLFVGTATFMITVLRQIWLLVSAYSLLIWAVGIVLGLAFIWIAATFEARRAQVLALAQYWAGELEEWD